MNYLFRMSKGVGDSLALTPFLFDLKTQYPDCSFYPLTSGHESVFAYNPYVDYSVLSHKHTEINISYVNGLNAVRLGATLHLTSAFYFDFIKQTNITVKQTTAKPQLFLTDEEKEFKPTSDPYWVIVAGYKSDVPLKSFGPKERYQQLVNKLVDKNKTIVQIGKTDDTNHIKHSHHELDNVISLIDQTTLREMYSVIYNSIGVICGNTQGMLIAAAFDKPCVVLAGGREQWFWTAYTKDNPALEGLTSDIKISNHHFHTIGKLSCCKSNGCWRGALTKPHNQSSFPTNFFCENVIESLSCNKSNAACMELINIDDVVKAVLTY